MLGLYVRLKLFLRKGKKGAEECAKKLIESYGIRTLDDIAYFITRFRYIPDPFFGIFDIQYDLPAFVVRGGGDCDDFALAVCRLAQALGKKAYYVTALHKNPFRNHVLAIVQDSPDSYRIFTPFVLLPRAHQTLEEAITYVKDLGGYWCIHAFEVTKKAHSK